MLLFKNEGTQEGAGAPAGEGWTSVPPVEHAAPEPAPPEAEAAPTAQPAPEAEPEPAPAPKASKKAKKRKPKAKKAAGKRKPAPRKKASAKKGKQGGKGKVGLLIAVAAFVVGGGIAGVYLMTRPSTPRDLINRAEQQLDAGNYNKAEEIYSEVLEMDGVDRTTTADAYLGLADTYVADEKTDLAIVSLQEGYEHTEDERLAYQLEQLGGESSITGNEDSEGSAPPRAAIQWESPAMERMIRLALGKTGAEPIYPDELSHVVSLKIMGSEHAVVNDVLRTYNMSVGYSVDGVLYQSYGDIESLRDLRHFTNLQKLTVGYNQVRDLSGIEALTKLDMLGLYCNEIEDLSPLSGLSNLRQVFLYYNNIRDLTPLSGCTGIQALWLQNNQIESLTPLSGLGNLKELFLSDNQIASLDALSGLSKLEFLFAENNRIGDIRTLQGLAALTDVSVRGNPVSDMSPVAHVTNINQRYSSAT